MSPPIDPLTRSTLHGPRLPADAPTTADRSGVATTAHESILDHRDERFGPDARGFDPRGFDPCGFDPRGSDSPGSDSSGFDSPGSPPGGGRR